MTKEKFRGEYGQSANGNFEVVDTMLVPHPFHITNKHVAYASDKCSGRLDEDAIERSGVPCGMKGCQLSYGEHEEALLITGKISLHCEDNPKEATPELHDYLLKIKEECEKNGYAGFAFIKYYDYHKVNKDA